MFMQGRQNLVPWYFLRLSTAMTSLQLSAEQFWPRSGWVVHNTQSRKIAHFDLQVYKWSPLKVIWVKLVKEENDFIFCTSVVRTHWTVAAKVSEVRRDTVALSTLATSLIVARLSCDWIDTRVRIIITLARRSRPTRLTGTHTTHKSRQTNFKHH